MAIFAPSHRPIGKTTHAAGTAGAHVCYITRAGAARELMAEHMPAGRDQARAWMDEREAADRKNGRVCDKLMLPLPLELDAAGRSDLVREFMHDFGGGRVSWLAAVHDRGKDERNPHAHIILRDKDHETGRRVFGTSEKGSTERIRELWETAINRSLERIGSHERVDRRSLEAQGIEREPGIHVGPNVRAMEDRGLRPESMAQDHTTSRGNERVVNWPEIDQGRTRADRQREIEAMNRQREDERGRGKDQQHAEHVPAIETPAAEREQQLDQLAADRERERLTKVAEHALQSMERTLAGWKVSPEPQREAVPEQSRLAERITAEQQAERDDQAAYIERQREAFEQQTRLRAEAEATLKRTQEPQREAEAQERDLGGMEVAAPFREAIQRPSYEVAVREPEPQQIELRLERSRLAQIITAGRDRLAALAGRLEQAFQMVRQRHEDREPIRIPDPPEIPQQERTPAVKRDPWEILNEPHRSPPPQEQEREKEDRGRSLWTDYSRGRERKGPGF